MTARLARLSRWSLMRESDTRPNDEGQPMHWHNTSRIAGVFLLGLVSTTVLAAQAGAKAVNTFFHLGVENFRWQEFDENGWRLLTEQGPRVRAGLRLGNSVLQTRGLLYEIDVSAYGGEVDYDGQDSTGVFTASDSRYTGWVAEMQGGYRVQSRSSIFAADLILGLGAESWRRDIADSRNTNGFSVGGLEEEYTLYYGRLGLGLLWPQGVSESYLQAGMRRPMSIDEKVDVFDFDVELSPEERWSAYAYYEFRHPRPHGAVLVRLFYESYRFDASPPELAGTTVVWQPESRMDVWGMRIGYGW